MVKNIFTILMFAAFFGQLPLFAQATDKKPPKQTPPKVAVPTIDISNELKAQVADYLQQNVSLSLSLSLDENRVSYLLKTANLLWQIDKNQSRQVFRASFEDIRKIVSQTDFEMNELDKILDTELSKPALQKEVFAKLGKINALTLAVTTQVSPTNPQIGYAFFEELKMSITNEQLRKSFDRSISLLQIPLLDEIAEKNIDRALTLAYKRLKEQGFFEDSIDLLLTVLKKEPKKANNFAKTILQSIKSSKNVRQYFSSMQRLLQIGKDNLSVTSNQKPLFSKSESDSLSELIDSYLYNPETKIINSPANSANLLTPREELIRAKLLNDVIKTMSAGKSEAKMLFQKELAAMIKPLENKKLPTVEKKRIIEAARQKILLVKDTQFRFEMLLLLSQKALQTDEKEPASQILLEAELINKTFPKDLTDFANNWLLAESYFGADADKSFIIVENIFLQLNQVINAYALFNEFLGGETFLESAEVKMESVGNAKVIGLEKLKSPLMKSLAERDFTRTANLSNRFDRAEFRLEARIQICRAILEPPKKNEKQ